MHKFLFLQGGTVMRIFLGIHCECIMYKIVGMANQCRMKLYFFFTKDECTVVLRKIIISKVKPGIHVSPVIGLC